MTIDGIIAHYSLPGYEPFSVEELAASYGRKWLNDTWQVQRFNELFAICRDGIIRPRKVRVVNQGDNSCSLVIDTRV